MSDFNPQFRILYEIIYDHVPRLLRQLLESRLHPSQLKDFLKATVCSTAHFRLGFNVVNALERNSYEDLDLSSLAKVYRCLPFRSNENDPLSSVIESLIRTRNKFCHHPSTNINHETFVEFFDTICRATESIEDFLGIERTYVKKYHELKYRILGPWNDEQELFHSNLQSLEQCISGLKRPNISHTELVSEQNSILRRIGLMKNKLYHYLREVENIESELVEMKIADEKIRKICEIFLPCDKGKVVTSNAYSLLRTSNDVSTKEHNLYHSDAKQNLTKLGKEVRQTTTGVTRCSSTVLSTEPLAKKDQNKTVDQGGSTTSDGVQSRDDHHNTVDQGGSSSSQSLSGREDHHKSAHQGGSSSTEGVPDRKDHQNTFHIGSNSSLECVSSREGFHNTDHIVNISSSHIFSADDFGCKPKQTEDKLKIIVSSSQVSLPSTFKSDSFYGHSKGETVIGNKTVIKPVERKPPDKKLEEHLSTDTEQKTKYGQLDNLTTNFKKERRKPPDCYEVFDLSSKCIPVEPDPVEVILKGDVVIAHTEEDRDLAVEFQNHMQIKYPKAIIETQEQAMLPGQFLFDIRPFLAYRYVFVLITRYYDKSVVRYKAQMLLRYRLKEMLTCSRVVPVLMENEEYPDEFLCLCPLNFSENLEKSQRNNLIETETYKHQCNLLLQQ